MDCGEVIEFFELVESKVKLSEDSDILIEKIEDIWKLSVGLKNRAIKVENGKEERRRRCYAKVLWSILIVFIFTFLIVVFGFVFCSDEDDDAI